ncbi:MAG: transcription antitermination factor NusB [Lachnospiraceae bacterium]|nr:transcription antitermination factor NusB [Robinsoniella sp.]MDY3766489.1 transcription antitermination factor NusB [Lachnospiraceae bacterium]
MSRREIREHIFKLLFLVEFHEGEELEEQVRLYLEQHDEIKDENLRYINEKYHKILEKLAEIDSQIDQVSKGWKIERMGKTDLTVLRLAYYEMKYDEDIPIGVAINEGVELAKLFGGEESPAFVNGILAKLV